ncbi:MAG: hypothetical protein GKR89_32575 [Candidatus Latescibacteria bacterium]|nr:hypothetical protein [Candidatus Latescibacterota bacterium]
MDRSFQVEKADDLTHLAQLGGASYSLTGRLDIRWTELANLQALKGLQAIDGDLVIKDNPYLQSLQGLENLRRIGGGLVLAVNPRLASLTALASLASLGDTLSLGGSPHLDLASLDALKERIGAGGHVVIAQPAYRIGRQEDIDWLARVGWASCSIAGHLLIEDSQLASLDGLEGVVRIGGNLVIANNPQLLNLAGLASLQRVDGDMRLSGNAQLVNVEGVDALSYIGGALNVAGPDLNGTPFSGLDHVGYEALINGLPLR